MNLPANNLRPDTEAWDRWGMVASALCVVHCIATPFAALVLPAIAATEGVTHGALGLAIVLFALLAFAPGLKVHGKRRVLALGMVGLALVWTALLLPEGWVADTSRDGLTVAGGLAMFAAHVFNVVLCRRCAVCRAACKAATVQSPAPI